MSTIHMNICAQTITPLCHNDGVVRQPSLHSLSRCSFNIMDPRTVDPLLEDTPEAAL